VRLLRLAIVNVPGQTIVEREATPYGECEENNDPKHNVYAEKYPVVYSKQVMQRAMRETSVQIHVDWHCWTTSILVAFSAC